MNFAPHRKQRTTCSACAGRGYFEHGVGFHRIQQLYPDLPVGEMLSRGWFGEVDEEDESACELAFLAFWGVASHAELREKHPAAVAESRALDLHLAHVDAVDRAIDSETVAGALAALAEAILARLERACGPASNRYRDDDAAIRRFSARLKGLKGELHATKV